MVTNQFKIQFTEFIPEDIKDGVLYISMEYATASHKCACGCGEEVVTPFTPTDWKMIYDGETVTLSPSIGNWSYPCRSHYLIQNNKVVWACDMSQSVIEKGRVRDKGNKERYYLGTDEPNVVNPNSHDRELQSTESSPKAGGLLNAILRFFGFIR